MLALTSPLDPTRNLRSTTLYALRNILNSISNWLPITARYSIDCFADTSTCSSDYAADCVCYAAYAVTVVRVVSRDLCVCVKKI
jgi:hypothetical protein